jgi:diguanylate cyclase (GGDEF)-like protein
MLKKISSFSKPLFMVVALLLVLLTGVIDCLTGPEISMSLFYLIPVAIAAWYVGKVEGTIVSFLAALDWFLAKLPGYQTMYSNPAIPYWNAFVELSFFLIITFTLASLKKKWDIETQLARTDVLTKVSNRRTFLETLALEIERANRYQHPLSLAYIDLDNFKWVNDHLGHAEGDKLLVCVGSILKEKTRLTDSVARLGGDEFAVLLPETNPIDAKVAMDKLQEELLAAMELNNWPVTFSIGLVSFIEVPDSVDLLVNEADILMYSVKKSGKNRISHKVVKSQELGLVISG